MSEPRKHYPSDVTDDEWAFAVPYLTLLRQDAPQRDYPLRDVFDALRWLVRTGAQWRYLPGDFPPWQTVYQQARRWVTAQVFEDMAEDLRAILRFGEGRDESPTGCVLDSRTLQSTPESGERAGYDGHKRRNGSKVHAAVDTLGHLLALRVTAASEQDRTQVAELAGAVQEATGGTVEVAFADQTYTGEAASQAASGQGMRLEVVKHAGAKKGFVLLPRRRVVERSFAWAARFRRLAWDYERLAETLAGWHWLAFVTIMLKHLLLDSA